MSSIILLKVLGKINGEICIDFSSFRLVRQVLFFCTKYPKIVHSSPKRAFGFEEIALMMMKIANFVIKVTAKCLSQELLLPSNNQLFNSVPATFRHVILTFCE